MQEKIKALKECQELVNEQVSQALNNLANCDSMYNIEQADFWLSIEQHVSLRLRVLVREDKRCQ